MESVVTPTNPNIDIIFIHGIHSNWKTTWGQIVERNECQQGPLGSPHPLRHHSPSRSEDAEFTSLWPTRALPNEFPQARIVIWGNKFVDPDNFTAVNFSRHVNEFVAAYKTFRGQAEHKVVFVAHSVGGLILKQALCQLRKESPQDLRSIQGVMFLGTPHHFKTSEGWAECLRKILGESSQTQIERAYDELIALSHDFVQLIDTCHWMHIVCVREKTLIKGASWVVPPEAARMTEKKVKIITAEANHFEMGRIDPTKDTHYQKILGELKTMSGRIEQPKGDIETGPDDDDHGDDLDDPAPRIVRHETILMGEIHVFLMDEREQMEGLLDPSNAEKLELALQSQDQGRYQEAAELFGALIESFSDPANHVPKKAEFFCRDKRAIMLYANGNYQECGLLCQENLKLKSESVPDDKASILKTARISALLHRRLGRYETAFEEIAIHLESAELSSKPWEYIKTMELLAKLLQDIKQYVLAEYILREVMEFAVSRYGLEVYSLTLSQLSSLSTLFWLRGHRRRAEQLSWFAFTELRGELGPDNLTVWAAARQHAFHLGYQGRLIEANTLLQDTLKRMEIHMDSHHPELLWTTCGIAAIHLLRGYIAEGSALLERTLQIYRSIPGQGSDRHNKRDVFWITEALRHLESVKTKNNGIYPYFTQFRDLPTSLVSFLHRPPQPAPANDNRIQGFLDTAIISLLAKPKGNDPASHVRAAAFIGDIDTVMSAVAGGVDVNATGGYHGTLLQAAAFSGNLKLVQYLLNHGANPLIEGGLLTSPIKAAIVRGYTDIVEALLQHIFTSGVRPPATLSPYLANLEAAVLFEREELVRILLEQGEDPNRQSPLFANALCQAAPTGNPKIVQVLLQYKAAINQESPLSLLPVVEVGLAVGDAVELDESCADYLRQLKSDVETKQNQTIHVLEIMLDEIEDRKKAGALTTEEGDQMKQQAVRFVDQPKAQLCAVSPEELDEFLMADYSAPKRFVTVH